MLSSGQDADWHGTEATFEPEPWDAPPRGILRADRRGRRCIDALAGRATTLGFGEPALVEALADAAGRYLGDGAAIDSRWERLGRPNDGGGESPLQTASASSTAAGGQSDWLAPLAAFLGSVPDAKDADLRSAGRGMVAGGIAAARVDGSPDEAVERAITLVRRRSGGRRFRIVAAVGADHGWTAGCRSAAGNPTRHAAFGPLMAGFIHVPYGDVEAFRRLDDDGIGGVLLSPLNMSGGLHRPPDDYFAAVADWCRQRDAVLVIDHTRLAIGSAASPTAWHWVASGVQADAFLFAAGLFGGLRAGLIVAGPRLFAAATSTSTPSEPESERRGVVAETPDRSGPQDTPQADGVDRLAESALVTTLRQLVDPPSPSRAASPSEPWVETTAEEFAVELAQALGDFRSVRDLQVTGNCFGIETDHLPAELVRRAGRHGLRIEVAGEHAVQMQLPSKVRRRDADALLACWRGVLEAADRSDAVADVREQGPARDRIDDRPDPGQRGAGPPDDNEDDDATFADAI